MKTRSLSLSEISKYCSNPKYGIGFEDGVFYYINGSPITMVLRAPTAGREMLTFVISLVDILMEADSPGIVLFGRSDVGVLNSGYIGQRVIHDLRLAQGDARSLRKAPGQWFDSGSKEELIVFFVQAVLFGWTGQCIFKDGNLLLNFTSSMRWFFRARTPVDIERIRTESASWGAVELSPSGL
jgi:hypothetical protein